MTSTVRGAEHFNATRVQEKLSYGGGTYGGERIVAYRSLREAGLSATDAHKTVKFADQYFHSLGVNKNTPVAIPKNRR